MRWHKDFGVGVLLSKVNIIDETLLKCVAEQLFIIQVSLVFIHFLLQFGTYSIEIVL